MFNPQLHIGQILSEKDIHSIFECQTQFGIRLGKKNKVIVIVSDATNKNPYVDRWAEDVLLYTGTDAGMNNNGDQTLTGTGNNNKILYDTWFSDRMDQYSLFLFVKLQRNQCTYKGRVKLASEPYQTQRIGDPKRRVWIFPLRLCPVEYQFVSDSLTLG